MANVVNEEDVCNTVSDSDSRVGLKSSSITTVLNSIWRQQQQQHPVAMIMDMTAVKDERVAIETPSFLPMR